MEHIEIRAVTSRGELESAFEIWPAVFPENQAFFQDRLDNDPTYAMDTTWIAKLDGNIAAAIQIFPYWMWCGSQRLKVGGIGSVATLPEYRRRGLAQDILRLQSRWMKAHGYDLSLLFTGINSFYEQVGWRTLEDKQFVLDCSRIPNLSQPTDYTVSSFQSNDLPAVMDIYESFNRYRTASMIRSKEYWLGQFSWNVVEPAEFLIAKKDLKSIAFMRFKRTQNGELLIKDCCYLPGEEAAVFLLLHVCLKSAETPTTKLHAKLPADHIMSQWFQTWQATSEEVSHVMWKVFDVAGLLQKLSGTFTERVKSAREEFHRELPFRLLIRSQASEVLVSIREQYVEVETITERAEYHQAVDISDTEILKLAIQGIEGCKENKRIYENPYLQLLFPQQNYIFWDADSF